MATVAVTFFLFVRFCVYKMDADSEDTRRVVHLSSKRGDPYSMDPHRLEEILAEITSGLGNIHNGFENVNITEILEEMVTEYVRVALEEESAPNFAEVAVLLQHCAQLYGRKVDYLYQHVLGICESLASAQPEAEADADAGAAGPSTPAAGASARRRGRRRTSAAALDDFSHIQIQECPHARRAPEPPRLPPTLPRMYLELEPRVMTPYDLPLRDSDGEPIGMPSDFYCTWRLQDGYLVDDLALPPDDDDDSGGGGGGGAADALRPLSLVELQAAIAAAAPQDPPPPPATPPPTPLAEPLGASTPLPAPPPPDPAPPPPTPAATATDLALVKRRKRKSTIYVDDYPLGSFKMFITEERLRLAACREFSLPGAWRALVVAQRARRVLDLRLSLTTHKEFRGFADMHPDIGGLFGFSAAEAGCARALAARLSSAWRSVDLESDDDGFFDRSSSSSFDSSHTDYFALPEPPAPSACSSAAAASASASASASLTLNSSAGSASLAEAGGAAAEEAAEWGAAVAARAAAAEARGALDVRALGGAVLRALAAAGAAEAAAAALRFPDLLRRAASEPHDVSRLLLATLFLANSGNVKIIRGAPLSVDSMSLALLSTDERLFVSAADAERDLLAPPPLAPAPAPAPATEAPGTPAPARGAPETPAPAREAPETPAPARGAHETPAPAREAPETPAAPARGAPAGDTPAPASEAPESPAAERASVIVSRPRPPPHI